MDASPELSLLPGASRLSPSRGCLRCRLKQSIIMSDNQGIDFGSWCMASIDTGEKFALGSEAEQRQWHLSYRTLIEALEPERDERYIGRSVPRNDVLYKVRGKAKYVANLSLPGMLHARFVRSIHPYARLKRVDVTKAAALPGVACVLTARDIPEER